MDAPMPSLSTVAPFGFDDLPPDQLLPLYQSLGAISCQYYRNEQNPPANEHATQLANNASLHIDSIHAIFGPTHDPSSPDEPTRLAAIQTYTREANLALSLNAPALVVHPAPLNAENRNVTATEYTARRKALIKSLHELADIGQSLKATFLIENLPNIAPFGHDVTDLAQIIREANSPHIRMCFDTGHAHITSNIYQSLQDAADVIDYLHIHDNDGSIDTHLMPGEGTIDWPKLSQIIKSHISNIPSMLELFYSPTDLAPRITPTLTQNLHQWLNITPT